MCVLSRDCFNIVNNNIICFTATLTGIRSCSGWRLEEEPRIIDPNTSAATNSTLVKFVYPDVKCWLDRSKKRGIYIYILFVLCTSWGVPILLSQGFNLLSNEKGGGVQYDRPSAVTCHLYWPYTYCVYTHISGWKGKCAVNDSPLGLSFTLLRRRYNDS